MSKKINIFENYEVALVENEAFDATNAFVAMTHEDAERDNADFDNARFQSRALTVVQNDNAQSVEAYIVAMQNAFAHRVAYEESKLANDSIFGKLARYVKTVSHPVIATVMLNANVSADLINHSVVKSARFNEKAFAKVIETARALAKVDSLNIYTRAILASMRAFEANEMLLTEREARACCSASGKLDSRERNALLVRTVKHYDPSTASTQASSSVQELRAYRVISETRDASGNVAFKLNDNATTRAILALV